MGLISAFSKAGAAIGTEVRYGPFLTVALPLTDDRSSLLLWVPT